MKKSSPALGIPKIKIPTIFYDDMPLVEEYDIEEPSEEPEAPFEPSMEEHRWHRVQLGMKERQKAEVFFPHEGWPVHLETGRPIYAPLTLGVDAALALSAIPAKFPKGKLLGVSNCGPACIGYFLRKDNSIVVWEYEHEILFLARIWVRKNMLVIKEGKESHRLSLKKLDELFRRSSKYGFDENGCNLSGWRWLGIAGSMIWNEIHAMGSLGSVLEWRCDSFHRHAYLTPAYLTERPFKKSLSLALLPPKSIQKEQRLSLPIVEVLEDYECEMELA